MDSIRQKDAQEDFKDVKSITEIFKYIPGVTLILYVLSIMKLYVFYQTFGFNVLPYLDFTELLTRLADDLIVTSVSLLIIIITINLLGNSKRITNLFYKVKNRETNKPFKIMNKICIGFMIFNIVIVVICLIFMHGKNHPIKFFALTCVVFPYIGFGSLLLYQNLIDKKPGTINRYAKKILAWGLLFFSLLFITVGIATFNSVDYALHSSTGSYIEIKDKTITSTASYYYIGSIKNFVLFYDENKNAVELFPISTVTKISIKQESQLFK